MATATEYERVSAMRREWAPREFLCLSEVPTTPQTPPQQRTLSATEADGFFFQRCGGGCRVIRKRLSA